MGGEAGRAQSVGLRSCACSRTGWGRHHHHHHHAGEHDADLTFQVHSEASADQENRPIPDKGVVLQEDVSSISINVISESRNPEVCDGMVDDLSRLTKSYRMLRPMK